MFEEITFSARVASWTQFWTLLASISGAFWHPRWLKPVLQIVLDRPRAVLYTSFSASEASKSAPRGLQEPSRQPRCPRGPPRRPRTAPRGLWDSIFSPQDPSKRAPRGKKHLGSKRPTTATQSSSGPLFQGPRPGGMRVSD